MFRIPVAIPDLSGDEEKYVSEAIRSSWISSTGSFIDRFEREFAKLCGTGTALSVCNGTLALHLAMLGLDVRPGDEVLVPSLTYVATANAVRYVGAEPVFVDVDPILGALILNYWRPVSHGRLKVLLLCIFMDILLIWIPLTILLLCMDYGLSRMRQKLTWLVIKAGLLEAWLK